MRKRLSYFKDIDKHFDSLEAQYSQLEIEKYVKLSSKARQDFSPNFIIEINKVSDAIYLGLNESIISGEYIIFDKIEEILEQIKSRINTVVSNIPLIDVKYANVVNKLFDDLQNSFGLPVLHSVSQYKQLLSNVKYKLSKTKSINLFDLITEQESLVINDNPLGTITHDLSHLFNLNIQLAQLDNNISVKKEFLELLLKIQNALENKFKGVPESALTTIDILIDKCKYLSFKILFRLEKDRKNFLYIYDYKDNELNADEIKKTIKFHKSFLEFSENHYSLSTDRFGPFYVKQKEIIDDKLEENKTLTLNEYHTLINYYKDKDRSSEKVNNLTEEFTSLYNFKYPVLKSRQFDVKAYNVAYNYFLNNKFSLMIYRGTASNEFTQKLEGVLKEITSIQEKTKIYNYFPYFRFSQYLIRAINKELGLAKFNFDYVQKLISKLELNLKKAFENFDWCRDKNFLPFQLPKKECTIEYNLNGEKIPIFLSSSFVLPLNYEEIRRDLKTMYSEFEKLQSQFKIRAIFREQQDKVEAISNEIGQHDKKQIEILSIFAAIVLFAIGNIQLYNNVENFNQAMLFMIVFAYCLGLFVMCIWVVTRERVSKMSWIHWGVLLSYIAFTIFLIFKIADPQKTKYPKKEPKASKAEIKK